MIQEKNNKKNILKLNKLSRQVVNRETGNIVIK